MSGEVCGDGGEFDKKPFDWSVSNDGANFSSCEYCSDIRRIQLESWSFSSCEYCSDMRRIQLKSPDDNSLLNDLTGDGAAGDCFDEVLFWLISSFGARVVGFFLGVENCGLKSVFGETCFNWLSSDC